MDKHFSDGAAVAHYPDKGETPSNYLFDEFLNLSTNCRSFQPEPYSTFLVIQGGGAKGAWQGAVLNRLIESGAINPAGAVGSSAGAINAWLISEKLRNVSKDPFLSFWIKVPIVAWTLLPFLLLRLLAHEAVKHLHRIWVERGIRFKPLLSQSIFSAIFRHLLPVGPAKIFTYIQVTNIDGAAPPNIRDDDAHPFFYFKPGDMESDLMGETPQTSAAEAIASSCSLPYIGPLLREGRTFADGGIYSNLPINTVFRGGTVGTHFVLCLCAVPIAELDAKSDFVDYRMLGLLHELKKFQEDQLKLFLENMNVVSATALAPIFVVEPEKRLCSKTARGFFAWPLLLWESYLGKKAANRFLDDLGKCQQNPSLLRKRALIEIVLPPLPVTPPKLTGHWVDWVNFGWKQKAP